VSKNEYKLRNASKSEEVYVGGVVLVQPSEDQSDEFAVVN